MFYGKIVHCDDWSRVKIFCPDLTYVDFIPGYGDSYIIDQPRYPVNQFRQRFRRSVLLSPTGVDLSNKEKILELVSSITTLTKVARESIINLEGDDLWNGIKIYMICGKYPKEVDAESLYDLFKVLGGPKSEIIHYFLSASIPVPVVFSTMLTFLIKMKNIESFSGNAIYRRDLNDVMKRITNVQSKVIKYLKSERETSDLLYFLLSL